MKTLVSFGSFKQVLAIGTVAMSALLISACSPAKWHETSPAHHTGDPALETKTTPTKASDLQPRQQMYISTEHMRCRTSPDQPDAKVKCTVNRNDIVEVVNNEPKGPDGLVEVRVVRTSEPNAPKSNVFVPPQYLSPTPLEDSKDERMADRYFMIQNVATEKLRVYERCDVKKNAARDCAHRLVLETEMTPGEDTPDKSRRTILGYYLLARWYKFYQDDNGFFPSWFDPEYPVIPAIGAELAVWQSPSFLPGGKKLDDESVRGAFGWYTAHLSPNAAYQWIHGTIGWGADGDRFVKIPTHGCTRVSNPTIALLRELLAPGAKVIKVYAKEALRDSSLSRYQEQNALKWNYILTRDGVRKDGSKSGRAGVIKRGVNPKDILEEGTLEVDQTPGVAEGNVYRVPEKSFHGYLLVDEGRLVQYEHPKELQVGGFTESILPGIAISLDTNIAVPSKKAH